MKVKSSKDYNFLILFASIIIALSTIPFIAIKASIVFLGVYLVLLYSVLMRYWIVMCRTLIFDEHGCTVKFLWFAKTYRWDELKTANFLDLRNSYGYRQPYKSGAIFSKNKIHKPKWMMPADYCMLVSPFTCFFVYFEPIIARNRGDLNFPNIYAVDKDVFLMKLSEWGVKLSENVPWCSE